jgi:hypothetical protein
VAGTIPVAAKTSGALLGRVRRHASLMVLLIRFAPGLRIAITAACAWVDVSPRRFSVLNLLSAFVWAAAWLVLVAWFGPSVLASVGLEGWKGAVVSGLALFALLKLFGSYERWAMERPESSCATSQGANDGSNRKVWQPGDSGNAADHSRVP